MVIKRIEIGTRNIIFTDFSKRLNPDFRINSRHGKIVNGPLQITSNSE